MSVLLFSHTASSLCFAEKTIYTQEVLAVVLQQLVEMNPLPTLFMRTVSIRIPLFVVLCMGAFFWDCSGYSYCGLGITEYTEFQLRKEHFL